MTVFGDANERTRKELAKSIRDELKSVGGITKVEVVGARDYEIAIEISQQDLERYGLTFQQIVNAFGYVDRCCRWFYKDTQWRYSFAC